jgi:DNA-binding NarL/FixJ family response regulator
MEGLRAVLTQTPDLAVEGTERSLEEAMRSLSLAQPDVMIVDKTFGMQAVLEWIGRARQIRKETAVVVWGISVTEAEALRYLHAGARGILDRKSVV